MEVQKDPGIQATKGVEQGSQWELLPPTGQFQATCGLQELLGQVSGRVATRDERLQPPKFQPITSHLISVTTLQEISKIQEYRQVHQEWGLRGHLQTLGSMVARTRPQSRQEQDLAKTVSPQIAQAYQTSVAK